MGRSLRRRNGGAHRIIVASSQAHTRKKKDPRQKESAKAATATIPVVITVAISFWPHRGSTFESLQSHGKSTRKRRLALSDVLPLLNRSYGDPISSSRSLALRLFTANLHWRRRRGRQRCHL
jgi:hypothetical protein